MAARFRLQTSGHKTNDEADRQRQQPGTSLCFLFFIFVGIALTLAGQTASLKSYRAVGPVVIVAGGLCQFFIAIWHSRNKLFLIDEGTSSNCHQESENTPQQNANPAQFTDKYSNDQFGPTHHFEVSSLSESSEMVPPSYDETVATETV